MSSGAVKSLEVCRVKVRLSGMQSNSACPLQRHDESDQKKQTQKMRLVGAGAHGVFFNFQSHNIT